MHNLKELGGNRMNKEGKAKVVCELKEGENKCILQPSAATNGREEGSTVGRAMDLEKKKVEKTKKKGKKKTRGKGDGDG